MTFNNLIILIIVFKSFIQRELDQFLKIVTSDDFNIREVTKGGFTQVRSKSNPWAFARLNDVAVNTFYEQAEMYGRYGMRPLAVEGSILLLPNHSSIVEVFGQVNVAPEGDASRSLARASLLQDVLNLITIDSKLEPLKISERELLIGHRDKVDQGDLLLLDIGYTCFGLLFLLQAKGIEFCVRLKEDWWLSIKDFRDSTEKERIVSYTLPTEDRVKLFDYHEMFDESIECRLLKVALKNVSYEILCTSLPDTEKYEHEEFEGLCHLKWNEEEAHKLLKSEVDVENFTGKTVKSVKQDFHAGKFIMTLCAAYIHPIDQKVTEEYQVDNRRKDNQKINLTNALDMTQDILIGTFVKRKFAETQAAVDNLVTKTREIISPDKSFIRKKLHKQPHIMNYIWI